MNELLVDRTNGTVELDGRFFGYFLENRNTLIPASTYKVNLTHSQRAHDGKLWTPWDECLLPELLNVPGHTGIRIHAANLERELVGCIALGLDRVDQTLLHSRAAVERLKADVRFPFWCHILEVRK